MERLTFPLFLGILASSGRFGVVERTPVMKEDLVGQEGCEFLNGCNLVGCGG